MNIGSMHSGEMDINNVNGLGYKFRGVTKEEYEKCTPRQRYFLAIGNCCSLGDLDSKFGVKTEIQDMEVFKDECRSHMKSISKISLNSMPSNFYEMP